MKTIIISLKVSSALANFILPILQAFREIILVFGRHLKRKVVRVVC